MYKLPGSSVKLKAVKSREGTEERAAASEEESVVVCVEQVDVASPVFSMRKKIYIPFAYFQHD